MALSCVPAAAATLEEPILQVGAAVAEAVKGGKLPTGSITSPEFIEGAAALAIQAACQKYGSSTFVGQEILHRQQLSRLAVKLSPAASVAAQAKAAALPRQGHLLVPLGEGAGQHTLRVPVSSQRVLIEPYDNTIIISPFPGVVAYSGVTAVILEAAGIPTTSDPDDLGKAYVAAELSPWPKVARASANCLTQAGWSPTYGRPASTNNSASSPGASSSQSALRTS